MPETIPADGVFVGRVIFSDVDAGARPAITLTGADTLNEAGEPLFRVGDDGEIYFIGGKVEPGQTYDVTIIATDSDGLFVESPVTITVNGLAVENDDGILIYSGDAPLLDENAVGTLAADGSGGEPLGELSDHAGSTSFSTSTTDFKVTTGTNATGDATYILTYTGTGEDYEAGATKKVEIVATKSETVESGFTGYNVTTAQTNGANDGKAYGYSGDITNGTITHTDTAATKATKTVADGTDKYRYLITADTAGASGQ